jgi:hypothetical protein
MCPCTRLEDSDSKNVTRLLLNLVLDGGEWWDSSPVLLLLRKEPQKSVTAYLVGPRAGIDGLEKEQLSLLLPQTESLFLGPTARSIVTTYYTIATH